MKAEVEIRDMTITLPIMRYGNWALTSFDTAANYFFPSTIQILRLTCNIQAFHPKLAFLNRDAPPGLLLGISV